MTTLATLTRLAMELPGTLAGDSDIAFSLLVDGKRKGYCWSWKERVDPKKPRVENLSVFGIRTRNLTEKDLIMAANPDRFVTDPHYFGYPAVLVKVSAITAAELRPLLRNGWEAIQASGKSTRRKPSPRTRTATPKQRKKR